MDCLKFATSDGLVGGPLHGPVLLRGGEPGMLGDDQAQPRERSDAEVSAAMTKALPLEHLFLVPNSFQCSTYNYLYNCLVPSQHCDLQRPSNISNRGVPNFGVSYGRDVHVPQTLHEPERWNCSFARAATAK